MIDVIVKGRRTGKTTQGINWLSQVRHGAVVCPYTNMARTLRSSHRDSDIDFLSAGSELFSGNQSSLGLIIRERSYDRIYVDDCFGLQDPVRFITGELFPLLIRHSGNSEPAMDRILMMGSPMGPQPEWLIENQGNLFNIIVEQPAPNTDERIMVDWDRQEWQGFLQEYTQPVIRMLSFEF